MNTVAQLFAQGFVGAIRLTVDLEHLARHHSQKPGPFFFRKQKREPNGSRLTWNIALRVLETEVARDAPEIVSLALQRHERRLGLAHCGLPGSTGSQDFEPASDLYWLMSSNMLLTMRERCLRAP